MADDAWKNGKEWCLGEAYQKRFGSLKIRADIWDCKWSPDNQLLATFSEDQTTLIWETVTWECVHMLEGHTTAVTDGFWANTPRKNDDDSSMQIFGTCADDQIIMLWNTSDWSL